MDQQIIGQRRGDRLALGVETHPFKKRVADAGAPPII
jgi:hypothetical protein